MKVKEEQWAVEDSSMNGDWQRRIMEMAFITGVVRAVRLKKQGSGR